jgi:hypothetical protein
VKKLAVLAVAFALTSPAHAVILLRSATRNTTAPTGSLANSGWQYQAQFAGFLGTPISSKWFITAQHIGGGVGQDLFYNGQQYFTDAVVNVPNTDLRLWRISGTFPTWAPLWNPSTDGLETGRRFVVFGRGTQRGAPVIAPIGGAAAPGGGDPVVLGTPNQTIPQGYEIRGWQWGVQDGVQSWGENTVTQSIDASSVGLGQLLYFTFDANGLLNEAHLSSGDSGGGLFINRSGTWKLAGINFGVDGPYRRRATDPSFQAAMFDQGGFFVNDPPEFLPPSPVDQPGGAYVSAISGSHSFIQGVIAGTTVSGSPSVPEPMTGAVVLSTLLLTLRRRRA